MWGFMYYSQERTPLLHFNVKFPLAGGTGTNIPFTQVPFPAR